MFCQLEKVLNIEICREGFEKIIKMFALEHVDNKESYDEAMAALPLSKTTTYILMKRMEFNYVTYVI